MQEHHISVHDVSQERFRGHDGRGRGWLRVCSTELSQVTVNVCQCRTPTYLTAMSRPHQLNHPQPQRLHLRLRLLNPVMRCLRYRPLHRRQLGGLSPAPTWEHERSREVN